MIYRITGPQSIQRIEPILKHICDKGDVVPIDATIDSSCKSKRIDFVWETACELSWRSRHSDSRVLNRLNNSIIVEDKANLAFLQLKMECPVLETFVAHNVNDVLLWAKKKWIDSMNHPSDSHTSRDWWVVKVARGNGGRDVWIMNSGNYTKVVKEFGGAEELVVQKYVHSPLLWNGKKFHFRAYTMLRADMSAYFYEKAFILTAGSLFDSDISADITKHITNLSVNKRFKGHPGQVVCALPEEYPTQFVQMQLLWKEVARACSSYMNQQINMNHFEFFGIDVIADTEGTCWLVEINKLPGLESSKNNQQAEDTMYNEMMESLLRLVLRPILPSSGGGNGWIKVAEAFSQEASANYSTAMPLPEGGSPQAPTWKNLLSWKAFTRRRENRNQILLPTADHSDICASPSELCGVAGCTKLQEGFPALRCSRCKHQLYCSKEHQKIHYPQHKGSCSPLFSAGNQPLSNARGSSLTMPSVAQSSIDTEVRISRCMFCGESVELRSEEEAVEHMRVCPSLQEQLNGKDQFTIPQVLRDKGIGLKDLKKG